MGVDEKFRSALSLWSSTVGNKGPRWSHRPGLGYACVCESVAVSVGALVQTEIMASIPARSDYSPGKQRAHSWPTPCRFLLSLVGCLLVANLLRFAHPKPSPRVSGMFRSLDSPFSDILPSTAVRILEGSFKWRHSRI